MKQVPGTCFILTFPIVGQKAFFLPEAKPYGYKSRLVYSYFSLEFKIFIKKYVHLFVHSQKKLYLCTNKLTPLPVEQRA